MDQITNLIDSNDHTGLKKYQNLYNINVFLVLTTCPDGSMNVGDKLITDTCLDIIRKEFPEHQFYFHIVFRATDISDKINIINEMRGILMPILAIRQETYPKVYKLCNLNRIKIPIIAFTSGECAIPGTFKNIDLLKYDEGTKKIMNLIESPIGCRDFLVLKQANNNGFSELKMVGDFGWYDLDMLNKPLDFKDIQNIVFTEPHRPIYQQNCMLIMREIRNMFPKANIYYSKHSKDTLIASKCTDEAKKLGFEVISMMGNTKNLDFYNNMDIHIGFRVHGYISFLRRRKPAILFIEDGRGTGQAHALGEVGCIYAFKMDNNDQIIPEPNIVPKLKKTIEHHKKNNFKDYKIPLAIIDKVYAENMKPMIAHHLSNVMIKNIK